MYSISFAMPTKNVMTSPGFAIAEFSAASMDGSDQVNRIFHRIEIVGASPGHRGIWTRQLSRRSNTLSL